MRSSPSTRTAAPMSDPRVATFGRSGFCPSSDTQSTVFDAVSYFRGAVYRWVRLPHTTSRGASAEFAGCTVRALPGRYRAPPPGLSALSLSARRAASSRGFGDPSSTARQPDGAFVQGEWNLTDRFLVRPASVRVRSPIDPFPSDSDNWRPSSRTCAPMEVLPVTRGVGRFTASPRRPDFAVCSGRGQRRTLVRFIGVCPASFSPVVPWNLPASGSTAWRRRWRLVPLTSFGRSVASGGASNLNIQTVRIAARTRTRANRGGFEFDLAKKSF